MIKSLVHDPLFLAQKSEPATPADAQVITDFLDTLRAHLDGCDGGPTGFDNLREDFINR